MANDVTKPSFGVKFVYGFGGIATASWAAIGALLLFFYNQVIGVPAHLVSLALGIIIFVDALWDPVIGQTSDRTRTQWGRRHPFMYAAIVLIPIAFFLRWNPPGEWSHAMLFAYILGTGLFFNLSSSLFDVPVGALAPELARSYHDRTVLISYRWVFLALGTIITNVLIYGVFLRDTPEFPRGQLNPGGYGPLSITVAVMVVVAMLVLTLGTHHKIPSLHKPPEDEIGLGEQLKQVVATLKNWNFGVSVVAGGIYGIGAGMTSGLTLYFNTFFWELPASQILFLTLISVPAAPIAALLAPIVGKRLGKKHGCMSLFFISVLFNTAPILLRLLGLFPANDSPLLVPFLAANLLIVSVLGLAGFILVSAMVADIVEDSQVATGRRSEGLIFTADSLPQKLITSLSTVAPGLLLTAIAFPVGAQPGPEATAAMERLAWLYLPLLFVISMASIATWSFFRIDEEKHAQNLAATAQLGPAE